MPGTSTGRVFISYRRQETAWPARQLYELLAGRFGPERVFKDVDSIAPGDDFVEQITEAVGSCDVLLALIGPQWLTMQDEHGDRRLDQEDDFVRLELEAALSRGVRVVPILVDGARMPQPSQLPEGLASLGRRQAVEINPVGFNTDRLMATLTAVLDARAAEAAAAERAATEVVEPVAAAVVEDLPVPEPMTEPEVLAEPVSEPAPQPQAVPPAEPPSGPPSGPGDAPPPARPSSRRMPLVLGAVGVVAAAAVLVAAHPWSSASDTGRQPGGGESPTGQASVSGSPPASTSPPVDGAALPTVLAHRGGLEEHQFETQQAMEAAALAGYAVETDVRYTSDGVAVLVHDERATKGLDCGGADIRVSQTTWDTLRETCHSKPTAADPKQYDVPTYAATMEGIAAASPSAWVFVEVKTDQSAGQVKSFLATIVDNGLRDRAVVTSFQPDYLDKIRKADPDMSRLLFVSKEQVPASQLKDADLWGVAVEKGVATKAYVQQLHDAGIRVVMWLLNDEEQWAKARDLGADLVLTDYPAKYEEWAASG